MMRLTPDTDRNPERDIAPPDEGDLRRIAEEAAQWIDRLRDPIDSDRSAFADWLGLSPLHIEEFLKMTVVDQELQNLGKQGAISKARPPDGTTDRQVTAFRDVPYPLRKFTAAVGLGGADSEIRAPRPGSRPIRRPVTVDSGIPADLRKTFYTQYRRPLLRVFLHRRIDDATAEDLLQQTFVLTYQKMHTEGLVDPNNLGGYLYRTACRLATAHWRGALSRCMEDDDECLSYLRDETPSLEDKLDREQLAKHIRALMDHLPVQRDREVLERFYLQEEPRTIIRDSLQLTNMQFNQVLWRARQRFGDILRREGVHSSFPGAGPVSEQAPQVSKRSQRDVFISYTHHDHKALEYLHTRLDAFRDKGDIHSWHDREISSGTVWHNEVASQLDRSRLFVPLVSPEFLSSDYCYDHEMTRAVRLAESGRLLVAPIIVKDCNWLVSPLRSFEPLPGDRKPIAAWKDPNDAFDQVAAALHRLLEDDPLIA